MCAWCYGFQPELEQFLTSYPAIKMDWVMGGLAPDNVQPMDHALRNSIASYWHQIEEVSQVTFNHEYWELNTPYRSTYPACRAVIAANQLKPDSAREMVKAIQSAYYKEAKNPSLVDTLVECAKTLGLEENEFLETLKSKETEEQLRNHFSMTRQFQVSGFPALFYIDDENQVYPLTLGFCNSENLEQRFNQVNGKVSTQ